MSAPTRRPRYRAAPSRRSAATARKRSAAQLWSGIALRAWWIAGIAASGLACSAGPPRSAEPVKPSPVYTSEPTGAAARAPLSGDGPGSAAQTSGGSPSHWRFVPLSLGSAPYPSQREFLAVATRCAAAAEASPNDHRGAADCLAERGFYRAQCSDGLDNDGDGLVDSPDDPGCAETHALSESPECDDDRDNDGDGLVDWDGGGVSHPDPECVDAPAGAREAAPPRRRMLNPF